MKILAGVIVALLAATALPAAPASWRDGRGGRVYDIQAPHERDRERRGNMQRPPARDYRRDERPPDRDYRRAERPPERDYRRAERAPERGPYSSGRLTEEERRDLRRDIDRANREIYKGR